MTFKEDLKEAIKKERPNLANGSLTTYVSILNSLYNKLRGNDGVEFYKKEKRAIMEHIKTLEKAQTRKTILSALFILTGDEDYQDLMMEDIKLVNNHYKLQKTDEDRKGKLKSFDEIKAIYNRLKTEYSKNPTHENMVNLLIGALMSGVFVPPRRLLDYTAMKIKNIDKDTDNYIEKNEFVFNTYKTAKKYGEQKVEIPKELRMIIAKWVKQNESDYLLTNKGKPFSSSTLSKRLSSIFGVSVDMLRSIYLSNLYKDVPLIKQMDKTATEMGHSAQSAFNFYVKKDETQKK